MLLSIGCSTPYYRSCQHDSDCPGGWHCFRGLPNADDGVCTTTCDSTAACTEVHGDRSFCTAMQLCAESCDTDLDCRPSAQCVPESDLVIAAGICSPRADGGM